jgi:PqqA peptide cyclase
LTTIAATPLTLVAELTHRCPLHCVYCSNPLELAKHDAELPTSTWARVFEEATAAGIVQADLTGGEPLARADIVELVKAGRDAGLYVSLITSGIPLTEEKLAALVAAGLDHLQLSFQGATEETARAVSGTHAHGKKLLVLRWLKQHRIGVTLNFVIHRQNIHELNEMLALVEAHQPGCAEFASAQYYGWGLVNRETLLPTREQLDLCRETLKAAEKRLRGKSRIVFVVPDYFARYPKACVGGWGRKLMVVTPDGSALPCHAAQVISGLRFENVREKAIAEIWESSSAFSRFRGQDWMQEPCRSCDRRHQDFGGCRCQAFLLSGDATATDPVCCLAPGRNNVDDLLSRSDERSLIQIGGNNNYVYRSNPDWTYPSSNRDQE